MVPNAGPTGTPFRGEGSSVVPSRSRRSWKETSHAMTTASHPTRDFPHCPRAAVGTRDPVAGSVRSESLG